MGAIEWQKSWNPESLSLFDSGVHSHQHFSYRDVKFTKRAKTPHFKRLVVIFFELMGSIEWKKGWDSESLSLFDSGVRSH